jgi:hypothetical protein
MIGLPSSYTAPNDKEARFTHCNDVVGLQP